MFVIDTEWFDILKNLVQKFVTDLKKGEFGMQLLKCLDFVGDLTLNLIEKLAKILDMINKAIGWLLSKIPFLNDALKAIEKAISNVLFKPINDCKKQANFSGFGVCSINFSRKVWWFS